jgi:hypothetical protein
MKTLLIATIFPLVAFANNVRIDIDISYVERGGYADKNITKEDNNNSGKNQSSDKESSDSKESSSENKSTQKD